MKTMKRMLAMLLVLAIVLGLCACGAPAKKQVVDTDSMSREDKELIAELIGGEDATKMTDKELDELIQQLVGSEDTEAANSAVATLGNQEKVEQPTVDVDQNQDAYDEDGAMNTPFDQVYPELIEQEKVAFSGESILIKMSSNKLTDGLKAAGVGALEEIVPMEGYSWYEAKLTEGTDAQEALAAVRQLSEVKLAEYNYEIQTAALDDYKHFDKEQDEDFKKNGHNKDQWHFHYCGIPDGYEEMETEGGDPSVIVAVIDSGVDYNHEDLKDNMWVNSKEIPDNGRDDDGNGYVDDYYGVDIVSGTGSGDDTNGHGTHVAGIVAARNNNVGTLGISYNVKIMNVKAAMHNGTLNQADIAKAVLYAYEMGAEVINMSFGGSACSIAVQDALATAYTRCVLVASAGNSGYPNQKTDNYDALPNYPAALNYVLGVMSVDENGTESVFTNWDVYKYNGVEYEVYAPGENIMSTLPGNQYGYLSGTSMAAPVVSAFAAILRSEFSDRDMYPTKFIYGQLASTSEYYAECLDPKAHAVDGKVHNLPQIVNLEAALTKLPKPELNLQDYALFDDPKYSSKNNGDGVIDAGETIALGLTIRNRWGMSENTMVTIDTLSQAGLEDPYIHIQNPTVNYGSVGTYSTQDAGRVYTNELLTGWENPFLITIAEDCPNDYRFTLNVTITCENALDEDDETVYVFGQDVPITVEEFVRSGKVLPSIIEEDMVLTPDNLYIIPNATVIQEGVTVRVEPGTHIQFWSDDANDPYASSYIAYLLVNGNFLVEGTKENPVYIYPSQLMDRYGVEIGSSSKGYVSLKYADITNFFYYTNHTGTGNNIDLADHCTFRQNYATNLYYRTLSNGKVTENRAYNSTMGTIGAKDCVFYKLGYENTVSLNGSANRCIFVECGYQLNCSTVNCVFLGNSYINRGTVSSSYYTLKKEMATQASGIPDASKVSVYYHKETGTTYIRSLSTIKSFILNQLGGSYAVPQTQEEWDWIRANVVPKNDSYVSFFGIQFDKTQYVWSDGSPIAEFADPTGLTKIAEKSHSFVLKGGKLQRDASYSSSYVCYIYEIPGEVYPWTIDFAETEVVLDLRTGYQITPVSAPLQLEPGSFIYESTDTSVVMVNESGSVVPVGVGTADVIVYAPDKGVYNHVSFRVLTREVHLEETEVTLYHRDTYQIAPPVAYPIHQENEKFIYSSSDNKIVTVSANGFVEAVGTGTATITVAAEDSLAENTITVTVLPRKVAVEKEQLVAYMEHTAQIVASVLPVQYEDDRFTFTSSDESVVKVNEDGMVIPVAVGVAEITVNNGRFTTPKKVSVEVLPFHHLESVSFGEKDVELEVGKTLQTSLVLAPENASAYDVFYRSNNEDVVIVNDSGVLTAVGSGQATITVSYQGKTATMQVTAYVKASSIQIPSGNITIGREYMTMELPAVTATNDGEPKLAWSTADTSIAEVVDGKLQLKAKGSTTLTATDLRSDTTATVKVTITETAPVIDGCGSDVYVNYEYGYWELPSVTLAPGVEAEVRWELDDTGYYKGAAELRDGKLIFKKMNSYIQLYAVDPRTEVKKSVWVRFYATAPEFAELVRTYDLSVGTAALPQITYAAGAPFQPEVYVTDTDVAVLEDGVLKLLSAGITSVVACDPRTGLIGNYYIRVTDGDVPTIVDVDTVYRDSEYDGSWGSLAVITYDDGEAYVTDRYTVSLLATNVQAVELSYSGYNGITYGLIWYRDGSMEIMQIDSDNSYLEKRNTDFMGEAIKDIAFSVQKLDDNPMYTNEDVQFTCFVLLEDGTYYPWGDGNDYGQMGTGDRFDVDYKYGPNGYEIEKILAGNTFTYFIYKNNSIGFAGGEERKRPYADNIYFPSEVDVMSSAIIEGTEMLMYWDGNGYSVNTPSGEDVSQGDEKKYPKFDSIDFSYSYASNSHTAVAFKDGVAYTFSISYLTWYERWEFSSLYEKRHVPDAVKAFNWDDGYVGYVAQSGFVFNYDGTLHIWPIPMSKENLELIDCNVSEDGVLREEQLILTFNKTIYHQWARIYVDGEYAGIMSTVGNKLVSKIIDSFEEGKTYSVEINAESMKGSFGEKNAEAYNITFTWQPEETAVPMMMSARRTLASPQKTFPALSENHTTMINAEVQRYYTPETFVQALTEMQEQLQYNATFYGNAILNPISTDTNVEHWFRPVATTVSAGTYTEIPLGGNYWGTTDTRAIELQMVDYTDYITYARLMYAPYLTEAPENTFPFVTNVQLFNKYGEQVTVAGNEQITFRVTFNRDMDTSIPLQVRFGSAEPYGDYEIEGQYVDARTWEGTYTLKTTIENGYQYFTISNGCSATDDLQLQPDQRRFFFEIDTTAAQALIMQGTATDTGIELKWTQDDFKTLMGYNVYRSTKEDGQYTRLNKTVIPADTMTFFDDTVEPGKVYYYNFTVVQTDLTESEPSGKIAIMSKDTMAPNIYHSPVANAFTGSNLVLSATITDNLNIAYANLYYRVAGTQQWSIIRMNKLNDKYSAIIPAQYVTVDGIEYYIEAFDGVSFTYKGNETDFFTIAVQEAIGADALGDVDGDGVITNLDALLLLYTINDKYNMSAEEFARADLNGDGELWAAEALRILQYVSGVVGSVKM